MILSSFRMPSPRFSFRAALLTSAALAFVAAPVLAQSAATPAQKQASVSRNAAASAPDNPYHGTVVEDIVARVNDQVISTSDYQRALAELEAQAQQKNLSPADLGEQKRQLLRDLIDNQLLLSRGKQLGITGQTETIRQLDELRKQNHLDSLEALEKAAEQQGVSFADFKASIQNRVITSQVIRDEVGRRINITSAEERQYYDDHKDQFTSPETVKLSEILVPTADPDNTAQVAEAQTKADALEANLKGGKDFAELAKTSSGNSTAAQGGLLGEYKRGQLAKVLEDATFSLQPGQYTEPIRTKQGFVILKVDAHNASAELPFDQARPQVEDALGAQKINPALRAYLTRLREEASISVEPGFTDAGSSTDEFRPIFSAYTPPQPKKKKTLERTRFSGRGAASKHGSIRGRTRNAAVAAQQSAQDSADAGVPPASAPPAGVPSLADVQTGNVPAAAPTAAPPQTIAKAQKPSKREKVRFGQAPRESLPEAATRTEDAGASTAGGNGSAVETASQDQAPSAGQAGVSSSNLHFENGESATEDQPTEKKVKTRFSQQAVKLKAAKIEKKRLAKTDQFPAPPPDAQELSDKREQAKPLGLAGDTSKKEPKPKPTEKTRFSDEAGKAKPAPPPKTEPVDSNAPPSPIAPKLNPPVQPAEPGIEPNTGTQPQGNAPGSGDPLGPAVAPAQPQPR